MFSVIRLFCQRLFSFSKADALHDKADRVTGIYRLADKSTAVFRKASSLSCPAVCGECCLNPTLEVSELEMIPLACELLRLGKVDEWYKRAQAVNFEGRCIFYTSDNGCGKCRVYPFRPLVCRLFGFSGNNDKYGRPRLVTCGRLKQVYAGGIEQVLERVANRDLKVPLMADFAMRVSSVSPDIAKNSVPINMAFRKAVERVELNQKFTKKG